MFLIHANSTVSKTAGGQIDDFADANLLTFYVPDLASVFTDRAVARKFADTAMFRIADLSI